MKKQGKVKIGLIIFLVVLVLLIAAGGGVYYYIKIYMPKKQAEQEALDKIVSYSKNAYVYDFIYNEKEQFLTVDTNADMSVSMNLYNDNYERQNKKTLKFQEEIKYPVYVDKLDNGYFMLFADKNSSASPFMYALRVNENLEEVWNSKIDLASPMEEVMKVIKNDEDTYTFYMAFVNGTRAKNNVVRINKDGVILVDKPLENVTTGSLVDLYEKDDKIGLVVRSNVGVDEERHVILATEGYEISNELSKYVKSTDYEEKRTFGDKTIVYGSKDKKGFVKVIGKKAEQEEQPATESVATTTTTAEGKTTTTAEVPATDATPEKTESDEKIYLERVIEKESAERIGEVRKAFILSDGKIALIYLEGKEITDFRKQKMNDVYNMNKVMILDETGKDVTSMDLAKLAKAKYAPIDAYVDNQNNIYVHAFVAQHQSIILKLSEQLDLQRAIELQEENDTYRHVSFSKDGKIYYATLGDNKIVYTVNEAEVITEDELAKVKDCVKNVLPVTTDPNSANKEKDETKTEENKTEENKDEPTLAEKED